MSDRSCLKGSVTLCSDSGHGSFLRTFTVKEMISASGASAVCYKARHEKSGNGVLKEFYPLTVHSLYRRDDGQLVCDPGAPEENERFDRLLKEYTEPYEMLLKARQHDELATFLPNFEIYYGVTGNDSRATAYIWTPEPCLETFDAVCRSIHENAADKPGVNLLRVLYSVESLVKCICAMHGEGLIHRDIKPSNFGFLKRGSELLTQTISLFDVDTVCSVYNVPADFARGSEGFMEPEALSRRANNLTDIYAIGATLFYAVIVTDETAASGYLYNPSYYPRIKELVDGSELICACEMNSHPHLRALLARILQKTLCRRDERYQCCEELLEDVQKALYYVVPAELADRGSAGEQWVLADADSLDVFDADKEKNSTLAMQYHLYTQPLCSSLKKGRDTLDLLLIGFGRYGQIYADLALQIMQMPGIRLRVTVISASADDKAVYLAERPELCRFFDIDGSLGSGKGFGELRFVTHTFSENDAQQNAKYLDKLFSGDPKPDRAFVACGRDEKNAFIAGTVSSFCHTFAAVDRGHISEQTAFECIDLCEDMSALPFFAELERMALNVHLIWNKNLNINFAEVKREFKKPYNHDSCVSFVLAMKYKLQGLGIDTDSADPAALARQYAEFLGTHEGQRDMLIYLEHRRWLTEKLCLGYRQIKDLDDCAGGLMRDEKRKRHVCIVTSTPDKGLSGFDWLTPDGQINKRKWDSPTPADLDRLDELDRMSVELHLMHMKHAAQTKRTDLLGGEIVSALTGLAGQDAACAVALRELIACMRAVWHGGNEQWRRCEGLKRAFCERIKASKAFSESDRRTARRLTELLYDRFYPVLACCVYRDYKLDDAALVDGIPFILTYSESVCMVIPMSLGASLDLSDLAAPTVVNPSRIIYTAYCRSGDELESIRQSLPRICAYMKKKQFAASVELIIGFTPGVLPYSVSQAEKELCDAESRRVTKVKLTEAGSRKDFAATLGAMLEKRRKSFDDLMLELNSTPLSCVMEGAGLYERFDSYSYDPAQMRFTLINGCDLLGFIKARPFITAEDMFLSSDSETHAAPEFYGDISALWELYCAHTDAWKGLCSQLSSYFQANDTAAVFKRRAGKKGFCRYIIPTACRRSAERILGALAAAGLTGTQGTVRSFTTRSCEISISDDHGNRAAFDELFSRVDILMQTDLVSTETDPASHAVRVIYNDLIVRALDLSTLPADVYELLDGLGRMGYLTNLTVSKAEGSVSFTFASEQIKDLLSESERVLGVYTYHKAKETGGFDDVKSRGEIGGITPDCVLTKGFSALFVECGTDRLAKPCKTAAGVNLKTVFVTDTDTANVQKRRDGIITVSGTGEIGNIGELLLRLI
ncbi:hypothetical protein [Ruminococcus sp. NK3A76]|uniref:protein kinase domain-containing protein n=1 Tax=Ruminococcus sp. NK3A76 TaxID=877411 RepID=UPI0004906868|nr:hypothetical protein [Ruminococcus sp. NK3A76]